MSEEETTLKKELWIKFEQWSECSTSHGYPNIFRNKSRFIKVMWFILLVISTAFCGLLIAKTVSEYFEFEVVTKIRVLNEIPFEFPTITFCSWNFFMTKAFFDYEKEFFERKKNITYNHKLDLDLKEVLYLQAQILSELNNRNEELKRYLSLPIEQILILCQFDLVLCNSSDFKEFFSPTFGKCFQFKKQFDLRTYTSGMFSGLYLEFYVPDLPSLIVFNFNKYVKLFIQDIPNDSLDFSSSLALQFGNTNWIQLKKEIVERLPYPYSDCKIISQAPDSLEEKKTDIEPRHEYRREDCLKNCMQEYIITMCKCFSNFYQNIFKNVSPCLSKEQTICAAKRVTEFLNIENECSKGCAYNCNSINFDYYTSLSNFPSRNYFSHLKKENVIKKNFENENISEITYDKLQERVASLNVFFNQLIYSKISESAKTEFFDLIANIGGTMGLFLGISILSFAELIELAVTLIFSVRKHYRGNRKIKQIQN